MHISFPFYRAHLQHLTAVEKKERVEKDLKSEVKEKEMENACMIHANRFNY